ncbi:hypothetical protein EDB83DRAFT_2323679 [Lactarius deliciosus]|nr:hypothetical protein EDB83DRAFT_2323679 [Lactarius deliciosus]
MQLSLPYVLPILVFLVLCMIWAVLLLPSTCHTYYLRGKEVIRLYSQSASAPAEAFAKAAVCLKWARKLIGTTDSESIAVRENDRRGLALFVDGRETRATFSCKGGYGAGSATLRKQPHLGEGPPAAAGVQHRLAKERRAGQAARRLDQPKIHGFRQLVLSPSAAPAIPLPTRVPSLWGNPAALDKAHCGIEPTHGWVKCQLDISSGEPATEWALGCGAPGTARINEYTS